ncbi:hypothetical protein KJ784_03215, partial [Patescibacteria group bacterium]|nr:hypothetical protein [Patescibacteria group bacterium]
MKKPCCGGEPEEISPQKTTTKIKEEVKRRYDEFAKEGGSAEGCCPLVGGGTESFALEHGLYSQEDLALIPK